MYRYLNTQYIQKQKVNEADISYGGFSVELSEQMYEIGEVRTLQFYILYLVRSIHLKDTVWLWVLYIYIYQ